MDEYIDRAEAKQLLLDYGDSFGANLLGKVPAADVRENVRGNWVTDDIRKCPACSKCGIINYEFVNWFYCPYCGAQMRSPKNE